MRKRTYCSKGRFIILEQDPNISNFIKASLSQGYDYESIRKALSKAYDQSLIDEHFKVARLSNEQPIIRFKTPTNYSNSQIEQLRTYIKAQRLNGFEDKDVKEALEHYGHGIDTVEMAFSLVHKTPDDKVYICHLEYR